jgi:uncharacterized membrane protein YfcA
MPLFLLPIAFAATAWLYAMAGFGGGSTYIALLVLSSLPLTAVPVIALACNLIVSSQGSVQLIRSGHARWALLLPLLAGSVPASFLGGAWRLPEATFIVILASGLSLAGVAMLVSSRAGAADEAAAIRPPQRTLLFFAGASLGALAGITGIGGGIYLAPVMHLMRWAPGHAIATVTSLFIAVNSAAGLAGQLTKGASLAGSVPLALLIACPLAVLIGGRIGSRHLSLHLPGDKIRTFTAAVILLVAVRLWLRIFVG